MGPVDFLRARLDEEEEGIRSCLANDEPNVSERDLDDVEAKRELIDWVVQTRAFFWNTDGSLTPSGFRALGPFVRIYRDHPDFDPAWLEHSNHAT